MKNITVAIDDETHRAARIRAAEMGTSVSALVKGYLQGLAEDAPPVAIDGVREVPMTFSAEPTNFTPLLQNSSQKGPEGQPYCVDGKWVWTKDGKPRKPGSLRGKLWVADDFDEWPDGFIDAMYGEETDAANNWWKPFSKPPETRPKT